MILRSMKDAADDDGIALDPEKQFVGKSAGERTAESTIVKWEVFRRGFKPRQGSGNRKKELISQSGATILVPAPSPVKIRLGRRADGDTPPHRRD
jgi:hypothetical protein